MFDYKLIEALAQVIETGGFERAAQRLCVTQSAVSQRIRLLEERCGQVLLARTTPPRPTRAGRLLLKHYRQVVLLEEGLGKELSSGSDHLPTRVAIGINADSLASWFLDAIEPMLAANELLLDLRVDDQEQTHGYLRNGEVVGCISTEPKAMQGCKVELLGCMTYRMLATPEFSAAWFPDGLSLQAAQRAPAVIFNHKDRLHHLYFQRLFSAVPDPLPAHYVCAPEQFMQMISAGYAYGMLPDWQSATLRERGRLCELIPASGVPVDLYWHCWNLDSPQLQRFSALLVSQAQILLAAS